MSRHRPASHRPTREQRAVRTPRTGAAPTRPTGRMRHPSPAPSRTEHQIGTLARRGPSRRHASTGLWLGEDRVDGTPAQGLSGPPGGPPAGHSADAATTPQQQKHAWKPAKGCLPEVLSPRDRRLKVEDEDPEALLHEAGGPRKEPKPGTGQKERAVTHPPSSGPSPSSAGPAALRPRTEGQETVASLRARYPPQHSSRARSRRDRGHGQKERPTGPLSAPAARQRDG